MKEKFLGFWWVLAFAILTFGLYEQASAKLLRATSRLETRTQELQEAIFQEESELEELKLQVGSQNDPTWIELALIKGLGLIPEGYTKIYFEEKK
ncbi:MAG: putative rane protein [Chlamydiia bacterium]|nr:putative rane protein [Chlamydiia bacterium]